jgi:hypothetical protein
MPSIPQIQNPPLASGPENYTHAELHAALITIMNMVIAENRMERMNIAAMLPDRILGLVMECLDAWTEAAKPTIH